MIDVWQYYQYNLDSQYARLLNMLELHMVLNKFSIRDIWQGSEYVSSSKYSSVTKGSIGNAPSYMFDRVLCLSGSHYARA